jgi:hypothetical protein
MLCVCVCVCVWTTPPPPCGYSPCVTSSLTKGWVCHLQLLLALASAVILRVESHGTHDHILLSRIPDSPNLEGQIPVFISPRNRVAWLYPRALSSFTSPPTTCRATVRYSTPSPHGIVAGSDLGLLMYASCGRRGAHRKADGGKPRAPWDFSLRHSVLIRVRVGVRSTSKLF